MKNIFIFSLMFLSATLFSNCNEKTDPPQQPENTPSPYAGSWTYSAVAMNNGTLKVAGQQIGTFTGTGKNMAGEVKITENPDSFSTELSFTAALELTVLAQTQNQDVPIGKRTSKGTWKIVDGEIKLTLDDGKPIEIISSSPTKIVFVGNFSEKVDPGTGTLVDANADVMFTIEK